MAEFNGFCDDWLRTGAHIDTWVAWSGIFEFSDKHYGQPLTCLFTALRGRLLEYVNRVYLNPATLLHAFVKGRRKLCAAVGFNTGHKC